jgi:hypothetical protein
MTVKSIEKYIETKLDPSQLFFFVFSLMQIIYVLRRRESESVSIFYF